MTDFIKPLPIEVQRVAFDTLRQEIAEELCAAGVDEKAEIALEDKLCRTPDHLPIVGRVPMWNQAGGEMNPMNTTNGWAYVVGFELSTPTSRHRITTCAAEAIHGTEVLSFNPDIFKIVDIQLILDCVSRLAQLRRADARMLDRELMGF